MVHALTPPRPAADTRQRADLLRHCEALMAADAALANAVPTDSERPRRIATIAILASNRIEGWSGAAAFNALVEAREAVGGTDPLARVAALCRAHGRLAAHGVVHGAPTGTLREQEVMVAHHRAPPAEKVPALMEDWQRLYGRPGGTQAARVLDALCAHHRLLYIHPFRDGNGRLARLDLEARLQAEGLQCGTHWAVSAALLRQEASYRTALAWADAPRRGDLDGRGALSEAGLAAYCTTLLVALLGEVHERGRHAGVACHTREQPQGFPHGR